MFPPYIKRFIQYLNSTVILSAVFALSVGLLVPGCADAPSDAREPGDETDQSGDTLTPDGNEQPGDDGELGDPAPPEQISAVSFPIDDAPVDSTWQWVADVPGARCGRPLAAGIENKTGFGLSFNASSDTLVIYFQGGGACWDEESCARDVELPFDGIGAVNLAGYGEEEFKRDILAPLDFPFTPAVLFNNSLVASLLTLLPNNTIASPESTVNAFADAQLVFFPYCTGDVFAGRQDAVADSGVYHAGAKNVDAYVAQLVHYYSATAAVQPKDIFLIGASAGGYGAIVNAPTFIEAFPAADIHVVSDSGVILNRNADNVEGIELEVTVKEAWSFDTPSDCAACDDSLFEVLPYYLERYAARLNYTLMSYASDPVISFFFQYDYSCDRPETIDLLSAYGNFYHVSSVQTGHTMLDFQYLPLVEQINEYIEGLGQASPLAAIVRANLGDFDQLASGELPPDFEVPFPNGNGVIHNWLMDYRQGVRSNIGADTLNACTP